MSRKQSSVLISDVEVTLSSESVATDLTISEDPSTVRTISTGDNTTIYSSHTTDKLFTNAMAGSTRTAESKTGSSIASMKFSTLSQPISGQRPPTCPTSTKSNRHLPGIRPEVKLPTLVESSVPKIDVSMLFQEIEKLKVQKYQLIDSKLKLESEVKKLKKNTSTSKGCPSEENSTSSISPVNVNHEKPFEQIQTYLMKLASSSLGADQGRYPRTPSPTFSVKYGNETSETNFEKILEIVKKLSDDRAQLEEKREVDLIKYNQLNDKYHQLKSDVNKYQMSGKGQSSELSSLLKIQSLENDRLKIQVRTVETKLERLQLDKETLETKLQLSTSMMETAQRELHKERSELTLQIQELSSKLRMFECCEANMNEFVTEAAAAADESNEDEIRKLVKTQSATVPTTRESQVMHSFELSKKIFALEKVNNEFRDEVGRLRDEREELRRQICTLQTAVELGKNQSVSNILTAFIAQCNKSDNLLRDVQLLQREKDAHILANSELLRDLKEIKKQSDALSVAKQSKSASSKDLDSASTTYRVKIIGSKPSEDTFSAPKSTEATSQRTNSSRRISFEDTSVGKCRHGVLLKDASTGKSESIIVLKGTGAAKSEPMILRDRTIRTNSNSLILCDGSIAAISESVTKSKPKRHRYFCHHRRSSSVTGKRVLKKDSYSSKIEHSMPAVSQTSTSHLQLANYERKAYRVSTQVKPRRSDTTTTGKSGATSAGKKGSTPSKKSSEVRAGQGGKDRRERHSSALAPSKKANDVMLSSTESGSCCSLYHSQSYFEVSTDLCMRVMEGRTSDEHINTIGSSVEDLDLDDLPVDTSHPTVDAVDRQMAGGNHANVKGKPRALSHTKISKPKHLTRRQ